MKTTLLLIISVLLIRNIHTVKILTPVDKDEVAADSFNLHMENFNKIFHHVEYVTISIGNRKLFSNILQLISSTKSYFLINNKFCSKSIINVHTNYFLNSYYESDEHSVGKRRRKRDLDIMARRTGTIAADRSDATQLDKKVTYSALINLKKQNDGGFIFEITNLDNFAYIIECYLTPGGIYLFIINGGKRSANSYANTSSDFMYDYFIDDGTENGITLDDIEMLLNDIWIHYQNYKIFIYLNRHIFTYNPFYYNFTVERYGKLIVNASDSITDGGEFLSEINLRKLNGYPLKIEIFQSTYAIEITDRKTRKKYFVGADIEVANTLRNVMNYTGIKIKSDVFQFGYRLANGSFTGTLNHLIRHSSDVAINGFFIKDYLTRDIEFTTGVYSDQLCLITEKANRIPSSLLPLICFESELWGMILLVMIGSSIFWCLIRRINDTTYFKRIYDANCKWPNSADRFNRTMWILKHKPFQYYQIFMDTLMLMGSAPLRRFTKVSTERCFIITLCLISLVFVSIFQSKLATVFIEPIYYKDIMTLKDMEKSNLQIALKYPAMMDDMFPANSTKLLEKLRNRLILIDPKKPQITVEMYQSLKLATITRRSKVKLDNAIYVTNQLIFLVPECPKTYNLAYVVAKDSVYLETINDILMHLCNGGLINKWINDMYYNQTLWDIRQYGYFYVAKFKTLTITDLQLAFMILALGTLISAALFVIELNIKRCINFFGKLNANEI